MFLLADGRGREAKMAFDGSAVGLKTAGRVRHAEPMWRFKRKSLLFPDRAEWTLAL